ncbi:MAG: hypothetical protein AAFN81_21790, partial [Bacteroidota bacterium]
MKRSRITQFFLLIGALFYLSIGQAQTVAIVGYNGTTGDGLSFVALQPLTSGTVIYFTDREYLSGTNAFNTGEGVWSYTIPGSGMAMGDVVTFTETGTSTNVLTVACTSGSCGTFNLESGSISLASTSAEGVYAYSDTDNNPNNGVTEVYAALISRGAFPASDDPSTDYPNSIVIDGFPAAGDHRQYTVASRSGSVTLADLADPSNYDAPIANGNTALSTAPFTSLVTSMPINCPTIGAVSPAPSSVCEGDPFNLTATGLMDMDMASNTEQDFGIEFVAFTSTPGDPYSGGTSLGTVSFVSLTAANTTAALVGATLATPGSYEVYAILSPAPTDATCRPSAMTSVTVNANPSVTLNITTNSTLCANDPVTLYTLTGSPTGGTYSGTGVTNLGDGISFTFNPAMGSVGANTVTYTFTDANGCSNSATDDITVNALPTVTMSVAGTGTCITAGVQTGLSGGTPTGGVYSGMGVTDDGNGMTYSFDPAVAGVGMTTITYTFTDGNGCTNSASDDTEVFAGGSASFTAPADLCVNAGVQAGLGGGIPTGGVYSGPGVTDDGNGMSYSFDPAAAGVAVHSITYTVATGGGGCPAAASDDVEVFAVPSASLTIAANEDEYCVDDATVAISLAGSPTGGVYSGPGVTNLGDGLSFTFDPATAGAGTATVTYTITNSDGCSDSSTDDITVNALPTVTMTVAGTGTCITAGVQSGLSGGTPSGGVYSGTGVFDDGNGMTYTFDPAIAGVGMTTITYTFTDGNGCTNSASDDEVVISTTATFTALADLCIDSGIQNNNGGGAPTGGVYSGAGVTDDGNGMTYTFNPVIAGVGVTTITYMTGTGSACTAMAMDDVEVFGLPAVSFTGTGSGTCINAGVQTMQDGGMPTGGIYNGAGVTDDGNGMTYTFDPAAAGVGVHPIMYTVTDGNGCSNTANLNREVFPIPDVQLVLGGSGTCITAGVLTGQSGGTPTGGVYSGPGVIDDANGMTYTFDPAIAGVGTHIITYDFTDPNGCGAGSATAEFEVFAAPNVTFDAPGVVCIDAGVQAGLGGGTPSGGVYSGTGVTDNMDGMTYSFDPTVAGIGTHTITYSFTDAQGCVGTATDDVE